jgi:hypothetical protein
LSKLTESVFSIGRKTSIDLNVRRENYFSVTIVKKHIDVES